MTVFEELLDWSVGRPSWQRDALRRLVHKGELSEEDVQGLTEICKSVHGLADQLEARPLTKADVPADRSVTEPVSLASIFHHRGVNALAEDQTLTFTPNLTVVYGDNAAGKTGYIRILKSACRSRGREKILGNVVSGVAPLSPQVAIKYRVGVEEDTREWAGKGEDELISRVSVFDAHSAAVYLTERTDVAFRPFGLDLFDKLVQACKSVRARLEKELRSLKQQGISAVQAKVPEETSVGRLLANITSLTKPETVRGLCVLSSDEESRLASLERSLADLRATNPKRLVREIGLRSGRVQALIQHIRHVEEVLSDDEVDSVFESRTEMCRKRDAAAKTRKLTFREDMLGGTGSESWVSLWEAARRFSQEHSYSSESFPVTREGARCVLCQQDFDHMARHRMENFEGFVKSTAEKELQASRNVFHARRKKFAELEVRTQSIAETLEEVRMENEVIGATVAAWLAGAEDRRKAVDLALSEDREIENCPCLDEVAGKLEALVKEMQSRVGTLRAGKAGESWGRLNKEAEELRARRTLAKYEDIVLEEIDRKKRIAAFGLCIEDTRTQAITRKSSAITRKVVTEKLRESFQSELSRLGFRHVEVELTDAGGTEGVLFHKIVLSRAPGVELPKVVSEGEQRCLSIAAFFAELSTAEDSSGIVFDDPVSSLDYRWREAVAKRLVEEAENRQVVVFTHDVVFLLALKEIAAELDIHQADQHVRNLPKGAGVCIQELPWVAQKVRKRIGHLRQLLQEAGKLHRQGHQAAYERQASVMYGLLREAWERGLEEVLLCGVVERFRPGVQTLQVSVIADVTRDDCTAVEKAITKCSKWLPGHDRAPAATAEIPEPDELARDINALDVWVREINSRRH